MIFFKDNDYYSRVLSAVQKNKRMGPVIPLSTPISTLFR